ncbi:MAG: DNA adenine methylase [Cyanobacteria bacterium]|nr:DNA adenine methylase [Cyanobacteriota bacterium]
MIKYLGSKRKILPRLMAALSNLEGVKSVLDAFSGTSRVGYELKKNGYQVFSNDINHYAHILAQCHVEAEASATASTARHLIDELNQIPGQPGYITETYCIKSRFFQPQNGEKIDAIRDQIDAWDLSPILKAICLTALMEAADRIDSTTGVQMAYLKQWAKRSYNPLQLRLPAMLDAAADRPCRSYQLDALDAAATIEADCAYLDPPYNQHSYLGNYHIWESLCRWDQPEVYGVACKRIDCKLSKSDFNSKPRSLPALTEMISRLRCPNLIVSFSNEGFIDRSAMEQLLAQKGHLQTIELDYKRYIGAQIGIHNPNGERIGVVSHVMNKEYIYLVSAQPLNLAETEQLASPPMTSP